MNELGDTLLTAIVELFTQRYEASATISALEKRLNSGKASFEDAEKYAEAVSSTLNRAYSEVLNGEDLPDGNIYWETCKAIIEKPLTDAYNKAAEATVKALDTQNAKNGINLRAQAGALDADRLSGVVNVANKAESFGEAAKAIAEPVKSVTRSAVVDTVQATADFQDAAGLDVKIIRTTRGKSPCEWCLAQAGAYDYASVKKRGHNVWRRHEKCLCKIEYSSRRTSHTVSNYRSARDASAAKIAERKARVLERDSTPEKIAARKKIAGINEQKKSSSLIKDAIIKQNQAYDLNLQLFAGRDLHKQTVSQLQKGIRKHLAQIDAHKKKINSPEQYYSDWNDAPEMVRQGRIKHWQKEIDVFTKNIADAQEELKKRESDG